MGISYQTGNLLTADAEALVNPVNTVGVMGKGLAFQFRCAFPESYNAYQTAYQERQLKIGRMNVFINSEISNPRYIINFPTKKHWRDKSQIEYIRQGLVGLSEVVEQYEIKSIAIPPLGCGLGGLDWKDVQPLIEKCFGRLPHVAVLLFVPSEKS